MLSSLRAPRAPRDILYDLSSFAALGGLGESHLPNTRRPECVSRRRWARGEIQEGIIFIFICVLRASARHFLPTYVCLAVSASVIPA